MVQGNPEENGNFHVHHMHQCPPSLIILSAKEPVRGTLTWNQTVYN